MTNSNKSLKRIVINVMVEIPKGSRNKYEYDKETGKMWLNRALYSSVHYPGDYGFIANTLAEDGDALDAMILMCEPTFPGCYVETKPIGVFNMSDEKGQDKKILCVPLKDPFWKDVNDIDEVPPHLLKEIKHFFSVYKDLERKKVTVGNWGHRKEAIKVIQDARGKFKK